MGSTDLTRVLGEVDGDQPETLAHGYGRGRRSVHAGLARLRRTTLYPAMLGAGLGLVYFCIGWLLNLAQSFGNTAAGPASFWPASGITMGILARSHPRRWPWLLAGIGIAETSFDLHNHLSVVVAVGWGVANMAEPLCSVLLLRRFGFGRLDLSRRDHLLPFILCAVVAGPAVSATVGGATAAAGGMGPFASSAVRWFVGDAIGVFLVAPAVLLFTDRRSSSPSGHPVLVLPAIASAALSFAPVPDRLAAAAMFLIVPAVLLVAFQAGQRLTAAAVLLVAITVDIGTIIGWGPFVELGGAFNGLVVAQVFLGSSAFTAFLVSALRSDLVRRADVERKLHDLAVRDTLTGLGNRRLLDELVSRQRQGGSTEGRLTGCLMIDLDGFKQVNDSLGHAAGDFVLVEVGRRLSATIRAEDLVVRLGGDEFLVWPKDPVTSEALRSLAARLEAAVGAPLQLGGRAVALGASIGVAIGPSGTGLEALIHAADQDLYAVKGQRRGRHPQRAPLRTAEATRSLAPDLARGLSRGELHLAFQPVLTLCDGRVYGVEALARWDHPERGAVPPDTFIAVAEQAGLIGQLGEWALREACRAIAGWNQAHPDHPELHLAVNLSPVQLADPRLYNSVADAIAESGLPGHLLTLEVTESTPVGAQGSTLALLWKLKTIGVRIAIDDFGKGYSNLSSLVQLPMDTIKLDATLAQAMGSARTAGFVSSMILAMQQGGLAVVAEGIENLEQVAGLRTMGCDLVQGFVFARPCRFEQLDVPGTEARAARILESLPPASPEDKPREVSFTVLVVDDDPAARHLAEYLLLSLGNVRVLSAASGAEFTEILRRATPDLILMDLRLPDAAGEDLARQVLQTISHPVPILAVTAYPDQLAEGTDHGGRFTGVIAKPILPDLFLPQIASLLGAA